MDVEFVGTNLEREERSPQSEFLQGSNIVRASKLYEKLLNGQLHKLVDISKMQYRFMSGVGLLKLCLF